MRIFGSKRRAIIVAALIPLGLVLIPAAKALNEWGPSRPTFTWAHPATYVTFNSITDNPSVGDERTFYDGYQVGTNNIQNNITVSDNEEVALRVYFHNNAASNLNLVAKNTRVKMVLPTTAATNETSVAYISANNANPASVWDSLHFNGSRPFTLDYEQGSAKLWNNVFQGAQLSDSIVTDSGAQVGYNAIDGNVPGCASFSGWVTIKVRVHMQQPSVNLACSGLDVAEVNRNRFDFTAHAFAQNAVIKSYSFTTKNAGGTTVDNTTVNTSASSAVYHFNQSNPGTYQVSAVVNTDHGSTNSADCTKQVTVQAVPPVTPPTTPPATPTPPPTVTTTPTASAATAAPLPNTGPGDVLEVFAGASAAGTAGHYLLSARRTRRMR